MGIPVESCMIMTFAMPEMLPQLTHWLVSQSPLPNSNHLANILPTSIVLPLQAESSLSNPARRTLPFSIGTLCSHTFHPGFRFVSSSSPVIIYSSSFRSSITTILLSLLHPASTKPATLSPTPWALHSLVSRCNSTSPYTINKGACLLGLSNSRSGSFFSPNDFPGGGKTER